MFNNSNQRNFGRINPKQQSSFIEGLLDMVNNDLFNSQPLRNEANDTSYFVKTDEFTQQLHTILSDYFMAKATVEENNVISILFTNGELFKMRITKQ